MGLTNYLQRLPQPNAVGRSDLVSDALAVLSRINNTLWKVRIYALGVNTIKSSFLTLTSSSERSAANHKAARNTLVAIVNFIVSLFSLALLKMQKHMFSRTAVFIHLYLKCIAAGSKFLV